MVTTKTPAQLRVISKILDQLALACKVRVDYPCSDGKGEIEFAQMAIVLRETADKLEAENGS